MLALANRARFIRALKSRPFALLWAGQAVSNLGDAAFYTTLAWQILILTGSATAMGIVLTAEMVPRLVFLLVGGVTADRPRRASLGFHRRWIDGCGVTSDWPECARSSPVGMRNLKGQSGSGSY